MLPRKGFTHQYTADMGDPPSLSALLTTSLKATKATSLKTEKKSEGRSLKRLETFREPLIMLDIHLTQTLLSPDLQFGHKTFLIDKLLSTLSYLL